MMGDRVGPRIVLTEEYATYFPLSAEVAMSATTPWQRATVPLLPALWKHLKMRRATQLFWRAKPILAAIQRMKQMMYAGRRPELSENPAIIKGEIAWNIFNLLVL